MQTLAEFLNSEKNQAYVLDKIIEGLRERGEWGKRGLFTKMGNEIGFSGAYVGQVLNRSKPLRENFVEKMAEYLCVDTNWLSGQGIPPDLEFIYKDAVEWREKGSTREQEYFDIAVEMVREHRSFIKAFLSIPEEQRREAIITLTLLEEFRKGPPDIFSKLISKAQLTPTPDEEE